MKTNTQILTSDNIDVPIKMSAELAKNFEELAKHNGLSFEDQAVELVGKALKRREAPSKKVLEH